MINTINEDLKDIYKGSTILNDLGVAFEDANEIQRTIKLFNDGYWFLMPFAFDASNIYGIRLTPEIQLLNSSIVYRGGGDAITLAPNIKTFPIFVNLKFCNSPTIVTKMIEDKLSTVDKVTREYFKYFREPEGIDFHKEYICSLDAKISINAIDEHFEKIFLDHWDHYYHTKEQDIYREILLDLIEKPRFLPKYEDRFFGIWQSRMNYALSNRAFLRRDIAFEEKERYYWNALSQSHGVDGLDAVFEVVPNLSADSGMTIRMIIDEFDLDDTDIVISNDLKLNPLFSAVQKLKEDGINYDGLAHFEAAKVLDQEFADSIGSWNAITCASYWAGKRNSQAVVPMWEAAIYLSEKSGWKEIHTTLVQQFEFYQKHK